jgi:hypothetical protein
VRYDHDSDGSSEATHDVTVGGLHIDVYREGEKITSNELTPPLPANEALDRAEEHLKQKPNTRSRGSKHGTVSRRPDDRRGVRRTP